MKEKASHPTQVLCAQLDHDTGHPGQEVPGIYRGVSRPLPNHAMSASADGDLGGVAGQDIKIHIGGELPQRIELLPEVKRG